MSEAQQTPDPAPRARLNRQRVLEAAVALADAEGLEAVSMRRLGQHLGVEAMSLYNHVANKEDLRGGMVEHVVAELNAEVADQPLPTSPAEWGDALKARSLAARQVMLRHRWAPAALQEHTAISPAIAQYYDGVAAILMAGGFDMDLTHHALHVLGSIALGFSQEMFNPGDAGDDDVDLSAVAEFVPHLAAMLADVAHDDPDSTIGWCDDQEEFEFGLDVVVTGLERRRELAAARTRGS